MSGLPPTDYNYPSAGQGTITKNLVKSFRISSVKNLGQIICQPHGKQVLILTVTKIQTIDNQTLILDVHEYKFYLKFSFRIFAKNLAGKKHTI